MQQKMHGKPIGAKYLVKMKKAADDSALIKD